MVSLLLKRLHEDVRSKNPKCIKLSNTSETQNDAMMHREAFKV